jgi:predicted Zn-dependent protease
MFPFDSIAGIRAVGRALLGRGAPRPALFVGVLASLIGCAHAPVTGRAQYNLIPDSVMLPMGKRTYKETLASAKLDKGSSSYDVLSRVGKRISKVADEPSYKWKYSLIEDDKTVNAWCLPGGKIAFYSGILPVLRNEAGMAFVMGHEVGHAVAHHGGERLSQQLTLLGGLAAMYLYVDRKTELSAQQKQIVIGALGAGAEVGIILPFSRKQETEADIIGLMYMARAGYPPEESIALWDRMEKETGGSSLPAFLSTHPSNDTRQANLKDWMGRAKKRYQRSGPISGAQGTLWK